MFTVSIETRFWASHQLVLPDGSKEPLHKHNWLIAAEVSSDKLNSTGLVMDFCQLKAMVDDIVGVFDNTQMEEIDYFKRHNCSAETLAKYIYEKLKPKLPGGIELESVRVVEEAGFSAKYAKE